MHDNIFRIEVKIKNQILLQENTSRQQVIQHVSIVSIYLQNLENLEIFGLI